MDGAMVAPAHDPEAVEGHARPAGATARPEWLAVNARSP